MITFVRKPGVFLSLPARFCMQTEPPPALTPLAARPSSSRSLRVSPAPLTVSPAQHEGGAHQTLLKGLLRPNPTSSALLLWQRPVLAAGPALAPCHRPPRPARPLLCGGAPAPGLLPRRDCFLLSCYFELARIYLLFGRAVNPRSTLLHRRGE